MKRWFRRLTPETFKNRILLAFLLFLLAPIALLVVYNFKETERVLQENASAKNMEQLAGIKNGFVDLMSLVMKTGLLLEQDTYLQSVMKEPEQLDDIKRKKAVENKFGGIENSFFLTGATVYYTLMDFHGNAYTSFLPQNALNYEELKAESWVKVLQREGGERYIWNPNDKNYVIREWTNSRKMLSLYQVLRDEGMKPYAYGRFSIDYEEWFSRTTEDRQEEGAYFLLNSSGQTMIQSIAEQTISETIISNIISSPEDALPTSFIDGKERTLYTFSRIKELDGYLVKKVPLAQLFKEVDKQKQRFFLGFGVILLLFVLLTYLISSTITVPLKLFQKKMDTSVKANLKVKLPEQGRGEILALTRSFNSMIDDINDLLERLKLEERQKQFVRFQVLLAQMNPHFLLNTLNTIKSIALDKDEDDIYEICVSLGKILETTLNTEVDLIFLKEEMVLIDSYMGIQKARFGHGITIEYEVDEELRYALIPKFCLQPLVENSLLHGFGQSPQSGLIEIKASARGSLLYLEVTDNGVGLEQANRKKPSRQRKSIGVQNIRESLELIFKNQSTGLTLEALDTGTRVVMHMPLLLSKPYRKDE
ncbi:sensor histidine kinase [Cohnella herbarum]|uniref:Histidine kinase n=1 Tax=Cohnella herbarum TaxID=2728023 RepID=A0A7Z2ZME0_9BACL|nr:histidine kinase [Cohnella herbarum]QJD84874.1 histidine kinase [Cohnella herbarum]